MRPTQPPGYVQAPELRKGGRGAAYSQRMPDIAGKLAEVRPAAVDEAAQLHEYAASRRKETIEELKRRSDELDAELAQLHRTRDEAIQRWKLAEENIESMLSSARAALQVATEALPSEQPMDSPREVLAGR